MTLCLSSLRRIAIKQYLGDKAVEVEAGLCSHGLSIASDKMEVVPIACTGTEKVEIRIELK